MTPDERFDPGPQRPASHDPDNPHGSEREPRDHEHPPHDDDAIPGTTPIDSTPEPGPTHGMDTIRWERRTHEPGPTGEPAERGPAATPAAENPAPDVVDLTEPPRESAGPAADAGVQSMSVESDPRVSSFPERDAPSRRPSERAFTYQAGERAFAYEAAERGPATRGRDDAPAGETGPRGTVVRVLAASTVVATALAVTFGILWAQTRATSPAEVADFLASEAEDVEARAGRLVTLLMNYDATNLDRVADRVLEMSTGNFREDYEEVLDQGLGNALEETSASSRGQILKGPDVSFRSASEAVAIVRMSQTTQSSENPAGRSFVYVMEVTMVDTADGGWKADRVEILSQDTA